MSIGTQTQPGEATGIDPGTEPIPPPIALLPEDMLYEVVDGEIKEKIVGVQESETATLLIEFLGPFLHSRRLGKVFSETIFRIGHPKDLQRRPDVAFVSYSKWPANRRVPSVSAWDLAPDLAVEVVSSTISAAEVQRKIHEYFEAGVSSVWVIYPGQKSIHVYASRTDIRGLEVGDELDGGELIPGFRLPLAALFEDDPE